MLQTGHTNTIILSIPSPLLKSNIVLVKTKWNREIVDALEKRCIEILYENFFKNIISIEVPGAIEIPYAIKQYWEHHQTNSRRASVFIALGCVIKGETPHFDYVCTMVSHSIAQLNLTIQAPTIMGVLTVNNQQQALDRIDPIHHKGEEFALAAIQMILFQDTLKR